MEIKRSNQKKENMLQNKPKLQTKRDNKQIKEEGNELGVINIFGKNSEIIK